MKYIAWGVLIIACFALGRLSYGPLAPVLLGKSEAVEANKELVREVSVHGPAGKLTISVDFTSIRPEELPRVVVLKERVRMGSDGDHPVHLAAGSEAKVVRIEGGILVIRSIDGPQEGIVRISATDLDQRIALVRAKEMLAFSLAKRRNGAPSPAPKPTAAPKAEPAPTRTPAVAANPPPKPEAPGPALEPEPAPKVPADDLYARQAEKLHPMPEVKPLLEIVHNWTAVPRNAYPERITLTVPVDFQVLNDGTAIGGGRLPEGSRVIPLDLVGDTLSISNGQDGFAGATVQVDDTDFKEQVKEHYEEFVKSQTELTLAKRKATRERLAKEAAHEAEMKQYNQGDDPRFDAVRESLRRGDAGFYQLDAASKWRWAGKETIDGVEYEVAFVMMASESAFGVIQRELKALIRENEVAKWIDVASGQEL